MDVSPAKRSYFTCANVWWKLLFHSTRFCERYKPCKMLKKDALLVYLQRRLFCYFIGRQPYSEGILSRAVHGVTFSFALDFLGLTTFLRQILGKIYSSDFLTTFYDNDFWFIPQQVRFLASSF